MRTWARRWGRGIAAFTPGRMLTRLAGECTAAGGALLKASTFTTALSQHCACGARVTKNLSQRWRTCPCGIEGDRDIVSAAIAATVAFTDTADPRTARIDDNQRRRLHDTVLAGRVHDIPVTRETAQHEGPVRSTIHHNPTSGAGEDGGPNPAAPAGQGQRPARPRNRPHGYTWGRRRTRRTSTDPTIQQSAPADL